MTKTPNSERRILLGQIGAAHGIRGDVTIRTFTGDPAAIASYGPLSDKSGAKTFKLKIVRVTDKGVVARIDGVTDRNGAEALRNIELYVARSKLPKTAAAEFYHADLIGLATIDAAGAVTGAVVSVQNFGAGDLLEVRFTGATGTDFIPFTDACVPAVDLDAGRVTVVPPEMTGETEPEGAGDANEE